MLTEPHIDKHLLKTRLQDAYALSVASMTFIPKGESSWGYRLADAAGTAYFLRLCPHGAVSREVLYLVDTLYNDCHLWAAVAPQPAQDGALLVEVEQYDAILFPFIDGVTFADRHPSPAALFELGQVLAQLHRCQVPQHLYPAVEHFDIRARELFLNVLWEANRDVAEDNAFRREARTLLRPATHKLLGLLRAQELLQSVVRRTPLHYVICHGDPTPGNLIISAAEQLRLVDWDDAILAPKEKDLSFWLDDQSGAFLAGYDAIAKDVRVEEQVVTFYHRLWTISQIADLGGTILFSDRDDVENKHDLKLLRRELRWING